MSFRIGATNQNLPITAFCWHGRIKQPTYQVILTNSVYPTLSLITSPT